MPLRKFERPDPGSTDSESRRAVCPDEAGFRALFITSRDAIVFTNGEDRFADANPAVNYSPANVSEIALIAQEVQPTGEFGHSSRTTKKVSRLDNPDTGTPSKRKIRVVLVDDHAVVRRGLAILLQEDPWIEIIGEASDGEAGVDIVRRLKPDVVLMDIGMPGMNGIQATRIIHTEFPEISVIGLSMFQEGEQAAAMRDAGAVNYLTKGGSPGCVFDAIHACRR